MQILLTSFWILNQDPYFFYIRIHNIRKNLQVFCLEAKLIRTNISMPIQYTSLTWLGCTTVHKTTGLTWLGCTTVHRTNGLTWLGCTTVHRTTGLTWLGCTTVQLCLPSEHAPADQHGLAADPQLVASLTPASTVIQQVLVVSINTLGMGWSISSFKGLAVWTIQFVHWKL